MKTKRQLVKRFVGAQLVLVAVGLGWLSAFILKGDIWTGCKVLVLILAIPGGCLCIWFASELRKLRSG